ncbi:MAG: hypothetical protein P4M11_09550 [Candidatus Pacebacteria bacterium]|nr:hypothetical protein [Candidatus Paceibacterota bacterium]
MVRGQCGDPHRFEDLVRELIYDLRDWQSIEATGLGGSDDGFDVRAFERTLNDNSDSEDEAGVTAPRPMVRASVIIKNRLHKVVGSSTKEFSKEILIRDLNDSHYPYDGEYSGFEKNPRWLKRTAIGHHPLGLWVHDREYYTYVDVEAKEWDYTSEIDLRKLYAATGDDVEELQAANGRARSVWTYTPRTKQAHFIIDSLVRYEDIALVDSEGDARFDCPHLFVDFAKNRGPYRGEWYHFNIPIRDKYQPDVNLNDEWKRISVFPKIPKESVIERKLREDKKVVLDAVSLKNFLEYKNDASTLFADDGKFDSLVIGNVVRVEHESNERFLEVTHVEQSTLGAYLKNHPQAWEIRKFANQQLGREVINDEILTILETQSAYWRDSG